jgi:enoyl-CoA hydratase
MAYENIVAETRGKVGLITLNRPNALNALSPDLMRELATVLDAFEADENIGCMVVTGSDKAFAAGADIKAMKEKTFMDVYKEDFITAEWERLARCRKPVIAAVAGYALGGGCELAMMCDFIIAADNAKFGQPEINLGIIPGAGGTQRLSRLVGKGHALKIALTGEAIDADEAYRIGLVNEVVPPEDLMAAAERLATAIKQGAPIATRFVKEAVHQGLDLPLDDGIRLEADLSTLIAQTEDAREGPRAFAERRPAVWQGR